MQIELDFEIDSQGEYAAQVGRYTVKIIREDYAESPWESWEGNPPYIRAGERYGESPSEVGNFPDVLDIVGGWSREQAKEFARMFAADVGAQSIRELWKEMAESEGPFAAGSDIASKLFDMWEIEAPSGNPLDVYAAAFRVAGWTYLEHTSTGYSQGDYAELVFVWTPREIEKYGVPRDRLAESLESAAKLYDAWAWGDVYGYVIEDSEGETVDSCFGFYTQSPDTDEESGMLDYIRQNMPEDWHVDPDIGAAAIYTA